MKIPQLLHQAEFKQEKKKKRYNVKMNITDGFMKGPFMKSCTGYRGPTRDHRANNHSIINTPRPEGLTRVNSFQNPHGNICRANQ